MTTTALSAETVKNFLYASTATVSMQMMKRGFRNCAIGGIKPLNPKATRLVGPAYTLRYIPGREDLDKPPTPADPPSAQRKAIEETPELPEGPPARFRWRQVSYRVTKAEGPERIAPEWWREKQASPTRDFYRVEDQDGRRYWLCREGFYGDAEAMPRWFVQGLFA